MLPQNTPNMRLPNQQNHSGHVEISQGIPSHGPQSQGIPSQGPSSQGIPSQAPPSQGFPNHVSQSPAMQSVQPQGLSVQMPTHQVPVSQTGAQTQCPPGAAPTFARDKPGQVGLPSSVQQQAAPPSPSGTILQQSTSNTSIPSQGSGSIQMPAPSSNNISAQSSQHIPILKGHVIHELQGPPQAAASNHPMHFQSPIQSQTTELQQQKQESKLDTAELISFD